MSCLGYLLFNLHLVYTNPVVVWDYFSMMAPLIQKMLYHPWIFFLHSHRDIIHWVILKCFSSQIKNSVIISRRCFFFPLLSTAGAAEFICNPSSLFCSVPAVSVQWDASSLCGLSSDGGYLQDAVCHAASPRPWSISQAVPPSQRGRQGSHP